MNFPDRIKLIFTMAMGRDIEIRLMEWADAQQLLRDGKVDALTEMALDSQWFMG